MYDELHRSETDDLLRAKFGTPHNPTGSDIIQDVLQLQCNLMHATQSRPAPTHIMDYMP